MKRYIMNGQLRKHCYRLAYMYLVQYLKLLHKTQKEEVEAVSKNYCRDWPSPIFLCQDPDNISALVNICRCIVMNY